MLEAGADPADAGEQIDESERGSATGARSRRDAGQSQQTRRSASRPSYQAHAGDAAERPRPFVGDQDDASAS